MLGVPHQELLLLPPLLRASPLHILHKLLLLVSTPPPRKTTQSPPSSRSTLHFFGQTHLLPFVPGLAHITSLFPSRVNSQIHKLSYLDLPGNIHGSNRFPEVSPLDGLGVWPSECTTVHPNKGLIWLSHPRRRAVKSTPRK